MANPSFSLRPTSDADAPALNDLYRRLTGKPRSVEAWRWQWRAGPAGPAPCWVLIDDSDGRVIGHHGVVPVLLRCKGERVIAGRTENTMLDPDYRKQLYWPGFEKQLLGEYLQRFPIVFTCAGKGAAAAVRRRMGYRIAASWETLRLAATPAFRMTRKLGRMGRAGQLLGPLALRRPPPGWELEPTLDLERIERLWKEVQGTYPLSAERDAATLRWRFLEHPFHDYSLDLLRRAGRDEGFLATWEEPVRGGGVRVWIEDLFVRDNDEQRHQAAMLACAWRLRGRPASVHLRTLALDRPLRRAALSLASSWMAPPRAVGSGEADLLVRAEGLDSQAPWDVTMLVDQGRQVLASYGG